MYNIIQLNDKDLSELQSIAKELGIKKTDSLKKEDLVYKILDEQAIVGATQKVAAEKANESQPRKRSRINVKKDGDKVYTATKDKAQKLEANTPQPAAAAAETVKETAPVAVTPQTEAVAETEDGYDLVSGYKQKRYDPLSKTIPTKLFNATARAVSGIKNLHDFNCGLKAYRRDVVKNIEVYGEMHRYIPYLAKNAGFPKIAEKVVHHQARKFGKTKFGGLNRFFNGYLDLITLWFLSKFGIKPMHFFGFMGSLMFILGFISVIIIGANKLYALSHGLPYILITDSPYFYLALTLMILGTQLFLAGFIGELIARNAPERNNYKIEKEF